jgi:hypothetical protein
LQSPQITIPVVGMEEEPSNRLRTTGVDRHELLRYADGTLRKYEEALISVMRGKGGRTQRSRS